MEASHLIFKNIDLDNYKGSILSFFYYLTEVIENIVVSDGLKLSGHIFQCLSNFITDFCGKIKEGSTLSNSLVLKLLNFLLNSKLYNKHDYITIVIIH